MVARKLLETIETAFGATGATFTLFSVAPPGGHGAVGGGPGFGAMGSAPDDADEEWAEGGETGADNGDGGFGGGPAGRGDVVPYVSDIRLVQLRKDDEPDHAHDADAVHISASIMLGRDAALTSIQRQKGEIRQRVDRAANEEIQPNVDAATTKLRGEFSTERLPELLYWDALEHGREHQGSRERNHEDQASPDKAPQLHDRKDAIYEA
ncbi:MAG: hypothetical protein Q9181_001434 [Wetmoreana brouardii]